MRTDYLYTNIYNPNEQIPLPSESTYLFGVSSEERSHLYKFLEPKNIECNFLEVKDLENDKIEVNNAIYKLKSQRDIESLLRLCNKNIYIDVTGLSSRICAPLIKKSVELKKDGHFRSIHIFYVEPQRYIVRRFQDAGVFNDLCDSIDGLNPLPGFAKIFSNEEKDNKLIALLGFEGGRFTHVVETEQPNNDNLIPIIGVPGYRPEYPYVAHWGNRIPLENTNTAHRIKYVAANSMVDSYLMLQKIKNENTDVWLKIAPIGTKPHAIGAILFAIRNPDTEIVYDNPIRSKSRSNGMGKIICCNIGKLLTA